MNPAVSQRSDPDWKTLYRAALVESEKSHIEQKISAALTAVLARQKELFGCAGSDEKEALEEALYLLRAYRNAGEHTDRSAAKAAA